MKKKRMIKQFKNVWLDYNIEMLEAPDLNYGQIFFMTLGFLPVLACFPCWLVAKFIYEPYLQELKEKEEI